MAAWTYLCLVNKGTSREAPETPREGQGASPLCFPSPQSSALPLSNSGVPWDWPSHKFHNYLTTMNPKFCGGDAGIILAPAEEMKAGSDQKVEQPRPPVQAFKAGTRLHPGTLAATKDTSQWDLELYFSQSLRISQDSDARDSSLLSPDSAKGSSLGGGGGLSPLLPMHLSTASLISLLYLGSPLPPLSLSSC